MASQLSAFEFSSALPHLHVLGDVCPMCEQPIPHDKFDEIKDRIEARERDHVIEIAKALENQFSEEKRKLQEEAARESAQRAAAAAATAKREAEEAAREELNKANRAREKAQSDLEQAKADAIANEARVRADATVTAQAAVQDQLRKQQQALAAAEAKVSSAETRLREQEEASKLQLDRQREVLDAQRDAAVNVEKAAAYKERLKLHEKVQSLERALEKKSNDELGEGAEVNLYDALKAEFPDDRIERVGKGQPGADIRHTVIESGRECGTILYDSKNHGAWRSDFLKKLASDQMAERAEHAILSTRAFPAGVRQVHVERGIIVANPARVCALVHIVRQQMVFNSTLKLSAEEREQKTAALYDFITSERCGNLLTRIDQLADELLDIQVQEQKAHERTWRRQGELLRTIQKTRADLCSQIDNIVSEPMQ